MKRTIFLSFCFLALLWPNLQASYPSAEERQEQEAILRTLNYYFESVNIGAPNEVRMAYHDEATFVHVNNQTKSIEMVPVKDFFAKIDADNYVNYERQIQLKKIDISGNAAIVETVIDYVNNGKRLHDYLSLLKIDGTWKIISRVSYKEYASFYEQPEWEITQFDQDKIEKSLRDYLKGGDKCDVERMARSLHDEVVMSYVEDHSEQLKIQDKSRHLKEYAKKSDNRLRRSHMIEFVHTRGNIAIAKVNVRFKDYQAILTDYISLAKEGDEWKVIQKVSHKDKMKYISSL